MIMTTWNPRYYPTLLDSAGFAKAKDLLAYFFPTQGERRVRAARALSRSTPNARSRGKRLTFRDLDLKHFEQEVERCWEIYNSAWEKNWGFFPMSRESFLHEAKVLKYIIWPEFAFMAEVNGEPAGFMIIVPDFHHAFKAVGNGRLLPDRTLQAPRRQATPPQRSHHDPRRKGRVSAARHFRAVRQRDVSSARKAFDVTGAEASWILEDNDKLNRPLHRTRRQGVSPVADLRSAHSDARTT